ncbi:MAG: hypothetical protein DYG94_07745 [Leptolyngbya sp. PLA3]|nr:MAG: hypothetical protein EDM82_10345 [Cyanobacteria bacterium CYA]MCE7968623.1 hypothetical protein [Leptolyngbya sp. PL-A3]
MTGSGVTGIDSMIENEHARALGPFVLARPLEPSPFGERWLARHGESHSDWTLHAFGPLMDKRERVMVLSWLETMESVRHAHLPQIRRETEPGSGRVWAAEPFLGNEDGLLSLARLVELKGGRMPPHEVGRAMTHVLDGCRFAHDHGFCHGVIGWNELLVDRHGSITIDLYGLRRRLDGLLTSDREVVRDEVRSVAMIGYRALTGLEAEEPRIRAARLVRRLDRAWDEWFEAALDPAGGFESASAAIEALPTAMREAETESRPSAALAVLNRLRTAWSSSSTPVQD